MNVIFPKTDQTTSLTALVAHLRTLYPPTNDGLLTIHGECSNLEFEPDKGSTFRTKAVDCKLDIHLFGETFEVYGIGWCSDGHSHSMKMLRDCQLNNFAATFTPCTKRILSLPAMEPPRQNKNNEASNKPEMSWGDLTNIRQEPKKVPTTRETQNNGTSFNFESLRPMDTVVHPAFGDCKVVQRVSRGKLKIRKPNGSLADLHIKLFSIQDQQRRNNRSRVTLSLNGENV